MTAFIFIIGSLVFVLVVVLVALLGYVTGYKDCQYDVYYKSRGLEHMRDE